MSPAAKTCGTDVRPSSSTTTHPSPEISQPRRSARSLCWIWSPAKNSMSQGMIEPSVSRTPSRVPASPSSAAGSADDDIDARVVHLVEFGRGCIGRGRFDDERDGGCPVQHSHSERAEVVVVADHNDRLVLRLVAVASRACERGMIDRTLRSDRCSGARRRRRSPGSTAEHARFARHRARPRIHRPLPRRRPLPHRPRRSPRDSRADPSAARDEIAGIGAVRSEVAVRRHGRRVRGRPPSTNSTRRRYLAAHNAAARPAGPPPITTTSTAASSSATRCSLRAPHHPRHNPMPGQLNIGDDRLANELLVAPTMIRRMVGAQIVEHVDHLRSVCTRNMGNRIRPAVLLSSHETPMETATSA